MSFWISPTYLLLASGFGSSLDPVHASLLGVIFFFFTGLHLGRREQ